MTTMKIAEIAFFLSLLTVTGASGNESEKIKVLVFTGGHDFEQEAFYSLFEGYDDIEYTKAVQPKANETFTNGTAQKYDVLVFYDLWQKITEEQKEGFIEYLQSGKGLVALHHCLASYSEWPEFLDIIGGRYLLKEQKIDGKMHSTSGYKHDEQIPVNVVDKDHPITQGVDDFEVRDETYSNFYTRPDVHVLLKTDHPNSSPNLAWTQQYGKGRVAYIQLGHDHHAFNNPNYRRLVVQAIRWAARKNDPISLFNNDDLSGWEQKGNAVWKVKDGILIGTQNEKGESGDLLTKRSFSDFELTVEFKVHWPANTGVWFRYQTPKTAYQADILEWKDPVCWTGTLYCSGKMFLSMNTNKDIVNREGWNTFVIRCQRDHIVIYLNGEKVSDVHDQSSGHGKIGFQVHAGEQYKDMAVIIRKAALRPM